MPWLFAAATLCQAESDYPSLCPTFQMNYRGDARGAIWRKWDLHVHTPASYEHEFGDREAPQTWDRYLAALASLPHEIAVLGINDYFSVEGYRRVRQAWLDGRLPRIQCILPVVEIRLEHLAGHSETQRLNYHVVFSDGIDADDIDHSFLSHLRARLESCEVCIGHRRGMAEYGRAVKDSAPPEKRPRGSDERVGFQHSYIRHADVEKALQASIFHGRHLCALGYTEWGAMRWEGGGAVIKRNLSESVDFLFGCSANPADHYAHVEKLKDARVRHVLIDASDAHRFADDSAIDRRLGSTLTWIKADPTFEGLRRALQCYDDRVFIGDEPAQLAKLRTHRNRFIRGIEIRKREDSGLEEVWFDGEIELNPGLVAVIGNQGSGKSALTDTLALGGNADTRSFSFLNDKRFRKAKANKAAHFGATVTWEDGEQYTYLLDAHRHADRPERVRYVPQQFFDHVTNELESEGGGSLYVEIEKAIFSHIPTAQRQDCTTFRDLVDARTRAVDDSLAELRSQLAQVNVEIVALEQEMAASVLRVLENRIAERKHQIEQHESQPPPEVAPPESEGLEEGIEALRSQIKELTEKVQAARAEETAEFTRQKALESARDTLQGLKGQAERKRDEIIKAIGEAGAGLDPAALLSVSLDINPITERIDAAAQKIQELRKQQNTSLQGSLAHRLSECDAELGKRTLSLDETHREYETYRTELQSWRDRLQALRSDPDDPDALDSLTSNLDRIKNEIPGKLTDLRSRRSALCKSIHGALLEKVQVYRGLASHVQSFLQTEELTREHYKLEFDLALTPIAVVEGFFERVKHHGPLAGVDKSKEWVQGQVDGCDFSSTDAVMEFANNLADKVGEGAAQDEEWWDAVCPMLRTNRTLDDLYDFIYDLSYVAPRYRLALRGCPIEQLSPGERGILLLIFYLIVDRSDLPLIIDQPEGNLNNQSIYQHLVPVIRKAKGRRQIIMVSHNPNIVVGCDADQVIHAHLDPSDRCRLTYTSGSLENPEFREFTVNKLEGTRPAFQKRSQAYGT